MCIHNEPRLMGYDALFYIMLLNVCSIKFGSKHSSNIVLCLLRNLMEQSLLIEPLYLTNQ